MHGHFQSHEKDGCHTTSYAIAETPCYKQTSWLYLLQNRLTAHQSFTLRE